MNPEAWSKPEDPIQGPSTKAQLRTEIEQQTAQFLAAGGDIRYCRTGQSGDFEYEFGRRGSETLTKDQVHTRLAKSGFGHAAAASALRYGKAFGIRLPAPCSTEGGIKRWLNADITQFIRAVRETGVVT